ncbi:MAG: outer membrane protein assembly factor BamE [Alphaproteobacteria bacterium]
MTFKKLQLLAATGLILGVASACTPTVAQRGNMLQDFQLERIEAGTHSRSDVLRMLGSPTTVAPFNEDIWYYIGQKTEKRGILDPEVVEERIVAVTFTPEGMVEQVADIDRERMNIPLADDVTPTHGNESTALQQFLGNIGRFNPQEEGR